MGQLDLIEPSIEAIFKNKSLLLNLDKEVTLALTSDLFDVLPPLSCGTKSTLGMFWKKPLLLWGIKLPSGAESSETTVQRNNLRGHNP
jgi:hypothetical protein